jgi:hypothetical protein
MARNNGRSSSSGRRHDASANPPEVRIRAACVHRRSGGPAAGISSGSGGRIASLQPRFEASANSSARSCRTGRPGARTGGWTVPSAQLPPTAHGSCWTHFSLPLPLVVRLTREATQGGCWVATNAPVVWSGCASAPPGRDALAQGLYPARNARTLGHVWGRNRHRLILNR